MADSTAVSIYTKLDRNSRSIRLLNILPDLSSDGLIQCTMHHTTIEASENEYSCLSYVWGPPTEDLNAIIVNGYVVHIRPNLFNFLSDARTRFTEKQLWIDALCIDQSNILERNHQVQQMGDIYSHAAEVLVWLAEPDVKLSHPGFENVLRDLEHEKLSDVAYDIMLAIHYNRYWIRAWIVQEIVLAKRIYILFGPLTLSLARFDRMGVYTRSLRSSKMSEIIQYRDNYIKRDPNSPSLTFSRFFVNRRRNILPECIDPRDWVFSLRAICEDGPKITVNYSISFFELVMSMLKLEEGKLCSCYIQLLCRIGLTNSFDPAWRAHLRFQIPSTKQPQNNSSEIDPKEVHELDLGPVTRSKGGKFSWCNGVITYFPVDDIHRDFSFSNIKLMKNNQGESLWRFSYWDMVRLPGSGHTQTESCLRDPTTITIGKWDL